MKTHSEKSEPNVAAQAMSGGIAILLGRLAVKSIDLLVLLVLARFLSQSDFGLIGLAMIFVVVLEAVFDIALNQVLLKEKHITREMLDTVFTISVIRGLILTGSICCLSMPIAYAYGEPKLTLLTCVLGFAPAFRGARSPAMIFFIRNMDFKWEVLTELTAKVIGGVVCVVIAVTTRNYWALVANVVVTPVALNMISYSIAPYRPVLSLREWHRFSSFTAWMTVSQIARALSWQFDKMLLGVFLGPAVFGRYSVAKDLSNTSQQAIIPPMLKPLTSACSVAHFRSADLGNFFLKSSRAILLIVGPLFLGLAILSDHVVMVALGENWSETGWILRWFSVAAIFGAMHRPVESLALVLDKNKQLALRRIITIFVRLPMILVGCIFYSYQGAVVALVLSEVSTFFLMAGLGCQFVGVRMSQLLDQYRSAGFALLMMGFCLLTLMPDSVTGMSVISRIVQTGIAGSVAALVYAASVLFCWWIQGTPSGLERSVVERLSSLLRSSPRTARVS